MKTLLPLLLCAALITPAVAQDPVEVPEALPTEGPAHPAKRSVPELGPNPSLGEALEAGYAARPIDEPAGSLSAGLLAIFPGIILHGLGHYHADETKTALQLLIAEAVAVGLVVGGELVESSTDYSGQVGGASNVMRHAGVILFMGSWLADIIGSFKGAASFDPDIRRVRGLRFLLAYRYTRDPNTTFRHHLLTGLKLDFGWLYIRPSVDLEVQLDTRRYVVEFAARVFRGKTVDNVLAVGSRLRRIATPAHGFSTLGAAGFIEGKLDLGVLIPNLRHVYILNRTGYGIEGFQLADKVGSTPDLLSQPAFTDTYLLLESGLQINAGPRTRLSFLYLLDPTLDIAPGEISGGVLESRLVHRYREDLDIDFRVSTGEGWAVWIGLEYGL